MKIHRWQQRIEKCLVPTWLAMMCALAMLAWGCRRASETTDVPDADDATSEQRFHIDKPQWPKPLPIDTEEVAAHDTSTAQVAELAGPVDSGPMPPPLSAKVGDFPTIGTRSSQPDTSVRGKSATPPNNERVAAQPPVASDTNIVVRNPDTHASTNADGSVDTHTVPDNDAPKPFEGWGTPKLVLVATGRMHGYLEPCGCTGLENQKGGMARRHTLLKQLAERGWPVVPLDVGNQVRRFGPQAERKMQQAALALGTMKYQAVALGPDDLRMSSGDLLSMVTDEQTRMFLSANVAIIDPDLMPTHKIIETAGVKIGVTAILGDSHRKTLKSDELIHQTAATALPTVITQLNEAECDIQVLLAHATLDETRTLAAKFPQFDVIVTAGGPIEPPFEPIVDEANETMIVQTGGKGMYACVVGLFGDDDLSLRYQRLPLDNQYADSKVMLSFLQQYQENLRRAGLSGLGLRPIPHPKGNQFVGSATCNDCHEDEYEIWKDSPHAHATDSIVRPPNSRGDISRHFDPECISCHVTGWNPQGFFPYASGYLGLQKTPHLVGSGCENCHGPGKAHVDAESGEVEADDAMLAKLREAMRLTLKEADKKCLECHDIDNSPDFHKKGAFEEYWQQIEH